MIQLIEAPPRSGKTYFFVNYLLKFCKFDKLYNEYVLDSNVLIITNVRGLKIRHWQFPECLKDMTFEEFFTEQNFHEIMKKTGKTHIILGIDECHELFPASMTIKTHPWLYTFFAIHGHFGLDVFLMTQGIEATTRIFNPLLECVIKVTPRSKKVYKTFTYNYYTKSGQKLRTDNLTTKQLVFNAYKSFEKDEHNKPKSALMQIAIITLCFFGIAGGVLSFAIKQVYARGHKVAPVEQQELYAKRDRLAPAASSKPSPVVVAALPVNATQEQIEPIQNVNQWRLYYLEGFLDKSGDIYYIINGRVFHHGPSFRNYNIYSNTVEFYGPEIQ